MMVRSSHRGRRRARRAWVRWGMNGEARGNKRRRARRRRRARGKGQRSSRYRARESRLMVLVGRRRSI